MVIHTLPRESQREACQHADRSRRRQYGQTGVRNVLRQANMDVLTEWHGDLLPEELSEAAMLRVDSTQQFTLIESESERVIGLTGSRLPCGRLPREHDREPIEVGDHAAVDRLLKGKQPCLMGEQLTD